MALCHWETSAGDNGNAHERAHIRPQEYSPVGSNLPLHHSKQIMLVLFETPAGYALFKVMDEGVLKNPDNIWEAFESPAKASKTYVCFVLVSDEVPWCDGRHGAWGQPQRSCCVGET